MPKSPDFSYVNEDGKRVSGSAASLHHIYTECGGMDGFVAEVSESTIKSLVTQLSDSISDELTKTAKKNRFKKIG